MFKDKILPPVYFYSIIILVFFLHSVLPIYQTARGSYRLIGLGVILLGAVINLLGNQAFYSEGALVSSADETTTLVTSGIFRYTRNPMYLGGIIILLGEAVLLGSVISILGPLAFYLIISILFIPAEEKKLEAKFPKKYLDYQKSVRRWI